MCRTPGQEAYYHVSILGRGLCACDAARGWLHSKEGNSCAVDRLKWALSGYTACFTTYWLCVFVLWDVEALGCAVPWFCLQVLLVTSCFRVFRYQAERRKALRRLRKIGEKTNIIFVMSAFVSVCLPVRMKQFGSHWPDFHGTRYLCVLRKRVEKIQVWLKSDKNNGCFGWGLIYIYGGITLNFSQKKKCFGQNVIDKLTHFIQSLLLAD